MAISYDEKLYSTKVFNKEKNRYEYTTGKTTQINDQTVEYGFLVDARLVDAPKETAEIIVKNSLLRETLITIPENVEPNNVRVFFENNEELRCGKIYVDKNTTVSFVNNSGICELSGQNILVRDSLNFTNNADVAVKTNVKAWLYGENHPYVTYKNFHINGCSIERTDERYYNSGEVIGKLKLISFETSNPGANNEFYADNVKCRIDDPSKEKDLAMGLRDSACVSASIGKENREADEVIKLVLENVSGICIGAVSGGEVELKNIRLGGGAKLDIITPFNYVSVIDYYGGDDSSLKIIQEKSDIDDFSYVTTTVNKVELSKKSRIRLASQDSSVYISDVLFSDCRGSEKDLENRAKYSKISLNNSPIHISNVKNFKTIGDIAAKKFFLSNCGNVELHLNDSPKSDFQDTLKLEASDCENIKVKGAITRVNPKIDIFGKNSNISLMGMRGNTHSNLNVYAKDAEILVNELNVEGGLTITRKSSLERVYVGLNVDLKVSNSEIKSIEFRNHLAETSRSASSIPIFKADICDSTIEHGVFASDDAYKPLRIDDSELKNINITGKAEINQSVLINTVSEGDLVAEGVHYNGLGCEHLKGVVLTYENSDVPTHKCVLKEDVNLSRGKKDFEVEL